MGDEPEFVHTLEQIRNRTLMSDYGCYMLWQYALDIAQLPGEMAEVGLPGRYGALIGDRRTPSVQTPASLR